MFNRTKPTTVAVIPPRKPPSLDEVATKIKELDVQLPPLDDEGKKMEIYRGVCDWLTQHIDNIVDILDLAPVAAPFTPVVKLALAVAVIPADGRKADEACREFKTRIIQIHVDSLPLREEGKHAKIDVAMDQILEELHDFVTKNFKYTTYKWVKGFQKGRVVGKIEAWTTRVDTLQRDFIVPTLRELHILAITTNRNAKKTFAATVRLEDSNSRIEDSLATLLLVVQPLGALLGGPQFSVTSNQVPQLDTHAIIRANQAFLPKSTQNPEQLIPKLQNIPLDFLLIGREHDLERTLDVLTKRNTKFNPCDTSSTFHVAIVGLGGIGKTALATKIAYHPRSKAIGRPVFIRCEKLDTLSLFQTTLLRLRAPIPLQPGEDLEQAVRKELDKKPTFLILDNLLDSTDPSHATYLEYIDSLTSIPTLTLLITTRNYIFTGRSTPRIIHRVQLDALSGVSAEALFRNEYARVDSDRALEAVEPDMIEILSLLDGVPLAIILVAAEARKAQSLADVARRWKDGRTWDNGTHGLITSVDLSHDIRFQSASISTPDTLALLCLLAKLPDPVLRCRDRCSHSVSLAFDAILKQSIGHWEVSQGQFSIRILQPTREYIARRHPVLDVNNDAVRALALDYFETAKPKRIEQAADNFMALCHNTMGLFGADLERARIRALVLCVSNREEVDLLLRGLLEQERVVTKRYVHLISYRLGTSNKLDLQRTTDLTRAAEEAEELGLGEDLLMAQILTAATQKHLSLDQIREACDCAKTAGQLYLQHEAYKEAAYTFKLAADLSPSMLLGRPGVPPSQSAGPMGSITSA